MEYKKLKPQNMSETELRQLWKKEYCETEIRTFDNVLVKFYEDMFDHIFYESANRIEKDKSILSLNRLEKLLWIKDALSDPTSILKMGWNTKEKKYYKDRRIAIVKGNYVVIIQFTGHLKARLVTAYEKTDIDNILESPNFERNEKYFGK